MENKYGFYKMTVEEFRNWIKTIRISRTICQIQQHHTYIPNYKHFDGSNHFERQKAMKECHVQQNGWADIGQHISVFPDGSIVTGRSFEKSPACISFQNAHAICIENVGNFDIGADVMTAQQANTIISLTAILCKKFGLQPSDKSIVYHHWFRLDNGTRNDGNGCNKTCPGTNFFGGNKVVNFKNSFLPLVIKELETHNYNPVLPTNCDYAMINTQSLNVRTGPNVNYNISKDVAAVYYGAIIRIVDTKDNWYKISQDKECWISSKYTNKVKRAIVGAPSLNVRIGASSEYKLIGVLKKGDEVFEYEKKENWIKIGLDDKWVNQKYLQY